MGRPGIYFSQEDREKIKKMYIEERKSRNQIAEYFKVGPGVIDRIFREEKIQSRGLNYLEIDEEIADKIVDNYVNKKMGLIPSGKEFGYNQYRVEKILKMRGIKKRTYLESKEIGEYRKYNCNKNYFKHQSSNMAYILGFLAADGNISKRENGIFIELQAQDKEILEKIKKETECERPIDDYIKNTTGQHLVKFKNWCKAWKEDLKIYGIVPAKTFILQPPHFLDEKYYIDYIRGYFDGDGSISYSPKGCHYVFTISGASKPVVEWIREIFANKYGITNNGITIQDLPSGHQMYKIDYYSRDKIEKIYNILYTKDSLFLQRKKEKFTTFINKIHETSNP
jgi:hypothetical protein